MERKKKSIQVKSLSKSNPVPFGNNIKNLYADYLIICRNVLDSPVLFIAEMGKIRKVIKVNIKHKRSYWLQPNDYENFKDKWKTIGNGI